MATLLEIARALADAVETVDLSSLTISGAEIASVTPFMVFNPAVPAVDVYPADPSADDSTFGPGESLQFWTVRARVAAVDEQGNQEILLALREPTGPTSLRTAILEDTDLLSLVEGMDVDWPTGYQPYRSQIGAADGASTTTFLGCEWRVRMFVNSEVES